MFKALRSYDFVKQGTKFKRVTKDQNDQLDLDERIRRLVRCCEKENHLQRFKLPEHVVCIGGFLQIELLAWVQVQVAVGKYNICLAHVQAIGRQLSPAFSVEFYEPSNGIYLKYDAEEFGPTMRSVSRECDSSLSTQV